MGVTQSPWLPMPAKGLVSLSPLRYPEWTPITLAKDSTRDSLPARLSSVSSETPDPCHPFPLIFEPAQPYPYAFEGEELLDQVAASWIPSSRFSVLFLELWTALR